MTSSLSQLIEKLIADKTITDVSVGRLGQARRVSFKCGCGSKVQRQSLRKHLETKQHNAWLGSIPTQNCDICYEEKKTSHFHTCSTCKKETCLDCKDKVSKCPFCRNTDGFTRSIRQDEFGNRQIVFNDPILGRFMFYILN